MANVGGQLALLILGVLAVKLVFTHLGADALGMVLFTQTINVVLAGVLDLGVPSITVRELAAHAGDDPGYIRDLMRTASTLYWAAFAVAAVAMLVTAPWIATHWVHLTAMGAATAATIVRILGVAALTVIPRVLYVSVCRGLQRMVYNNAIDVGTGLLQQLGIVLILAGGGSLFMVIVWMAVTYCAALVVYVAVVTRLLGFVAVIPGWSTQVIRRNARFSVHMTAISALSVIHTFADRLTVSKFLSVATLGWYTFATSVVGRGALLTNAIADAAYPSLSGLFKRGEFAAMAAQYRRLQDLVCYLQVPLYAGVIYVSLPLFTALFGRPAAKALLLPVAVLCLGYWANGTLTMLYVQSLAVGRPELTSSLSLQAVLITVPVAIGSVAVFGLPGASLGFLSYHVFFYVAGVPIYCRECLHIPVLRWYRQVGTVLGLAGLTYGTGWVAADWIGDLQLPALAALYVAATIAFGLAAWRTSDPDLRVLVRRWLDRGPEGWQSHAA
jgi:O-antigen/teichoic acid export membrane protein